jgi:hypothetical protein
LEIESETSVPASKTAITLPMQSSRRRERKRPGGNITSLLFILAWAVGLSKP